MIDSDVNIVIGTRISAFMLTFFHCNKVLRFDCYCILRFGFEFEVIG
jgi:hypothetical protein